MGGKEICTESHIEAEETILKPVISQVHEESDHDQPIPLVDPHKAGRRIEELSQDSLPRDVDPESSESIRGPIHDPEVRFLLL